MITKEQPAYRKRLPGYLERGIVRGWHYVNVGPETIQYQEGPKAYNGHCFWKRCRHSWFMNAKPGSAEVSCTVPSGQRVVRPWYKGGGSLPSSFTLAPPPKGLLWENFWSQVDLNCSDAVLVYSGILQAVPLVGGALKFNSIMRKVAKKLSRELRRKPFTTAIKTAISLDFIDRFVVKPTLDDAHKFMDAHNYVLRVMNSMYERQAHQLPTAYTCTVPSNRRELSRTSVSWNAGPNIPANLYGTSVLEEDAGITGFVIADTSYDTDAVDPIRLWAARCGVSRPLDSVWDLIPFSFVIDYFSRAGDFISGLSDKMSDQDGLRGKVQKLHDSWTCETVQYRRTTTWNRMEEQPHDGYYSEIKFTEGSNILSTGYFDRIPWAFFTDNHVSHDMFSVDLSFTQKRTLAQLIIQSKL